MPLLRTNLRGRTAAGRHTEQDLPGERYWSIVQPGRGGPLRHRTCVWTAARTGKHAIARHTARAFFIARMSPGRPRWRSAPTRPFDALVSSPPPTLRFAALRGAGSSGRTRLGDARFAMLVGAIDAELGGAGHADGRDAAVRRAVAGIARTRRLAPRRQRCWPGSWMSGATPCWVQERLSEELVRDTGPQSAVRQRPRRRARGAGGCEHPGDRAEGLGAGRDDLPRRDLAGHGRPRPLGGARPPRGGDRGRRPRSGTRRCPTRRPPTTRVTTRSS